MARVAANDFAIACGCLFDCRSLSQGRDAGFKVFPNPSDDLGVLPRSVLDHYQSKHEEI